MRRKYFLMTLVEILTLVFIAFYIYNKVLFISNNSKIQTNKVVSKFNIREKNFYER